MERSSNGKIEMDGGKWRRDRRRVSAKEKVESHTGAFKKSRTEMMEIQTHERQSKRKIMDGKLMKTNENQLS